MHHPTAPFSAVRFSTVLLTLIQFRSKSQNTQPCRLPFSMTPLAITIYPEFCGIVCVLHLAHDTVRNYHQTVLCVSTWVSPGQPFRGQTVRRPL